MDIYYLLQVGVSDNYKLVQSVITSFRKCYYLTKYRDSI